MTVIEQRAYEAVIDAAIRFLETGICEHCYKKEVHCDD